MRSALNGPFNLLLHRAGHNNQTVKSLITSSFNQNRRRDNYDGMRVPGFDLGDHAGLPRPDRRMHQFVQFLKQRRLVENKRSQLAPIDALFRRENASAEFADYRVIGLPIGQQHLMTELVGFNEMTAEIGQCMSHETLAAGQTSGEPYPEHTCCSAACTVLLISIAMVSGPTPPGTGVYALASSRAAAASTSPISPLPSVPRFWPTSITTAPGRMKSRVMRFARPIAATRISARRHSSARFAVFEWQIVTV